MKQNQRKTAEGILFTDQYQLTMAQLYFRMGMHEQTVQFDHFFRQYPDYGEHKAGFCINAGLEWLLDWMTESSFRDEDIDLLRSQNGRMGKPVFQEDFLAWLRENGNFANISLKAIPEGRVIHPNEPVTVVEGPLAIAQLLETPLLNHLNYPILVATKAARIRLSGKGQPLLEFGLRRGHGTGANAGARAALIGGADFTSNVGISHVLGFPPKGTHGHSMVQAFMAIGMGELEAFRAYADCYPDDCLLLVDTIDTINSGIPNAITVFEELQKKGHQAVGIRLDSGDFAALSVRAMKMLNQAGFSETIIVLSDNLDELRIIEKLEDADFSKMQESQIRDIMRKRRLGIECSGFITRILDGWTREIYKKPIYSLIKFNKGGLGKLYSMLRPYTHIDVETLVHPDNAREIIKPQELMPGDLIRFNTTIDHVIIVTSTERDEDLKKARYAHSILEDDGEGIKLGSIEFVNADKNDLLSQKWSEEPQTGRVISDKGEPKVYRLRIVENYPKKII